MRISDWSSDVCSSDLAYDGLSDEGWLKLSRNWAFFFAFMALLNEALRAFLPFDTWLTLHVWAVTALSFLFALSNVPMLLRHGPNPGAKVASAETGEITPPHGRSDDQTPEPTSLLPISHSVYCQKK